MPSYLMNIKKLRNNSEKKTKILIAPLNWGIGHATRCIPIINALIKEGFEPVIASDGDALILLQKEFPKLKSFRLPSYNIRYTKKGKNLTYRLLWDSPRIINAVNQEKKFVAELIKKENINGIISDNRFGVRSKMVYSVYITHQLNVLSGITSGLTSKLHQRIISKFDECWVPDYLGNKNLAGKLSHLNRSVLHVKYIGPISRFDQNISFPKKIAETKKYNLMILLSGPEPQRRILEDKLLNELKTYSKKVLFVRGVINKKENAIEKNTLNNKYIEMVNFMMKDDLQKAILQSEVIISRSGYSTIMDLERLNASSFFIPTPGQYEQEYLAKYLERQNIASYATQDEFKIKLLDQNKNYLGFKNDKLRKNESPFPFICFMQSRNS